MGLHALLSARETPVRVGLIGAGKFGAMFLAQAIRTPGIQILGIADLSFDRARGSLQRIGWPVEQFGASSFDERSEEHTSELQSLMRISYAVFCLNKKKKK